MASLRPSVKDSDGYIEKVVKYIPAEIVAGYTALVGYLRVETSVKDIPNNYKSYYLVVLFALAFFSPIWTYYAVYDNETASFHNPKRKALFHAGISFFAFPIWVYAIGNLLLKAILCKCDKIECVDCGKYSPVLGSIILVLFTIITPLLERIFLGKRKGPT